MRKLFVRVCLIQLLFATVLLGQSNRASVTGTVTDSSGAVLPGVSVTATNIDTGVVTTNVTNRDGVYSVLNLFPGKYSVDFKKDGFKTVNEQNITLLSTQVAEINERLEVGGIAESVTVTATAPVLDKETPTIGTNMNGNVVTDLPLSIYGGGRFVENFAVAITPGYSPISSPYGAVVNGGQWFTKDYTVDGTSASSSIPGDSMETGPGMEAVQELQAETSGIDSQSAITSGGVVAFTLKSGTNSFHGSAFGYGVNELLDANTWTNDSLGEPKAKQRAWDYGGSLGGPIRRDKTFFFGTFERYTQTDLRYGGYSAFVPTTDFLNGDLSALLNTSNVLGVDKYGNTVYQGAIFNPADPGAVFVGNQIPTTSFSNVSNKIIALYKQDYAPQQPGLNGNDRTLLSNSPLQTPNQAVIKLDHNLSANDRLSGSWIYNHRPRTLLDSPTVWQAGSTDGGPLSDGRLQMVRSQQWRVSESHVFSPNVMNVFNVAYNWYWNGSIPTSSATNWPSQLGFGSTGADNFPSISFGNSVNGYSMTGIGNSWQGNFIGATTITNDSVTWSKGRHSLTFGGEFRAYDVNSHGGSGALNFNFTPNTTDGGYTGQAGFGFASFLLGDVTSAGETTPFNLYGRRKGLSVFAQDSYKLRSNLTIDAGLRWQYTFPYHEKYGHWANFDLNAIDPTLNVPGTLEYLNGPGDTFETKEYWDDFGPSIGFAYSPAGKWVVRGAFGLLYLPPQEPYFDGVPDAFAPGFRGTNNVNSAFNWDNGYPGVLVPGSKTTDPSTLFPLVSVDPHALMGAFTDQFNIGVQYEINPTMRVEAAYVGNRGHHLPDAALAWDEPSSSTFLNTVNSNPGISPYNDYIFCSTQGAAVTGQGVNGITCPYNNFYGPALAAIAPEPQVANWSAFYYFYYDLNYVGLPLAKSYYDSMLVDLVKRAGNLTMDLNYTLSRQQSDSFSAQEEYNGYYTPVQDFGNLNQASHTLTNYDQTHIVKGFIEYQLPLGKGQRWLAGDGKIVNGIVGGWTLGSLLLYTSGQPFQAGVNNPYWPLWGNFYPNFNLSGFNGPADPHAFQASTPSNPNPPAVFYMPGSVASSPIPANTTLNLVALGRGPGDVSALRCPGNANEDASIMKGFPIRERFNLQFRAEFYNVFNRHTYAINGCGGGSTQVGATNFGQVTGVNSTPRAGQFALRFEF